MASYRVKIRTKLGSLREKIVEADSESEAIALAKESFPLQEKIWIEGEPSDTPLKPESDKETKNRIGEMKRDAEITKAQSKRTEGLVWLAVGVFLTVVTFLFVRNAFIIAFGPVIWGGYIFKSADTRIKNLQAEKDAGLPFIER